MDWLRGLAAEIEGLTVGLVRMNGERKSLLGLVGKACWGLYESLQGLVGKLAGLIGELVGLIGELVGRRKTCRKT